ncbi:hypothetical protein EXT66_20775 [Pectobacterium carotovorum subsp. carotovorum]|nr:hypothetical protein [Pectobacterium carotovorum]MCL6336209.1 hypothetical protein [Pectobacterium carotovorum subsp. carotovorum]MCL6349229.1 hypothetical protein [Pectobacterium carotovorum subsp. carotovorum]MCL6403690.1 hypothetical protein [Pectobacterium carotovorum subsp. carotovorum]
MNMKPLFLGLILGTSYIGMAAANDLDSARTSAESAFSHDRAEAREKASEARTKAHEHDAQAREKTNDFKADLKSREPEARKDAEKGWADVKSKAGNFNSRAEKNARETADSIHNAAEKHQR